MKIAKCRRCAIYSRKSTQEGLEQDFNSLDAQRASCDAYIQSQTHEGWNLIPHSYDDGGFSGGSMERPALKALICDIERGRIDIVVVYKVDRLTRSLTDFARLVEVFDARQVSFVSVTQAFNTTTSMGRLTLNVLLSFAQFEREVTAERIRDKFKASKEKGMWMGGRPPLGLDVKERQLVINIEEAEKVRHTFKRYLYLKSVTMLKLEFEQESIHSKRWVTQAGKENGGNPFTRGALYALLQNPIMIGKVRHKDHIHEGRHDGIIDDALWEKVQAHLKANRVKRAHSSNAKAPSLVAGLLEDHQGARLRPRHTKRRGRRHRYYVGPDMTLPAHDIESLVIGEIITLLTDQSALAGLVQNGSASGLKAMLAKANALATQLKTHPCRGVLKELVSKFVIGPDQIDIHLELHGLRGAIDDETDGTDPGKLGEDTYVMTRTIHLKRSGHGKRIILGHGKDRDTPKADPSLLKAIARAQVWFEDLKSGASYKDIAIRDGIDQRHVARTIRLAFLAPDIVASILTGCEPQDLTSERLPRPPNPPADWPAQRELLGFV